MRGGEEDSLGGEFVEARAGDVVVAVDAEIATEVVPVHEKHVVAVLVSH